MKDKEKVAKILIYVEWIIICVMMANLLLKVPELLQNTLFIISMLLPIIAAVLDKRWKGHFLIILFFLLVLIFMNASFYTDYGIGKYALIALIPVYLANAIYPFICLKKKMNEKELTFLTCISKIAMIPLFAILFLLGMLMMVFPGTILVIPFLIGIDYLLLLITSFYGIASLQTIHKNKKISTTTFIFHILFQLCFGLDVLSAIYLFFKVRKKENKAISVN